MRNPLSSNSSIICLLLCAVSATSLASDPLPSWNDGKSRQAILNFVAQVTSEGGADYVPEAKRKGWTLVDMKQDRKILYPTN